METFFNPRDQNTKSDADIISISQRSGPCAGNESQNSQAKVPFLQTQPINIVNAPNRGQRSCLIPSMASFKQEKPQRIVSQGSSMVSRHIYKKHRRQENPQFIVPQGSPMVSGCVYNNFWNYGQENPQFIVPQGSSMVSGCDYNNFWNYGSIHGTPTIQNQLNFPCSVTTTRSSIDRKRSSIGHMKPKSSKKQKTTASPVFANQTIELHNDVTASSGINLREERELLFSAPKQKRQDSEATQRLVQDEEEHLIFNKKLLQKKLADIMSRCGIESKSKDVERCLSKCVEERLRRLISDMIRSSKQRLDIEKAKHQSFVTSDVQQKTLMLNKQAYDKMAKKQDKEPEKLQKLKQVERNMRDCYSEDENERRSKTHKIAKKECDIMRAKAANSAICAAFGGEDKQTKWQVMAEEARLIRDAKLSKNLNCGTSKKPKEDAVVSPSREAEHVISVKDLISALEREPQMRKSTMLYCLYERDGS